MSDNIKFSVIIVAAGSGSRLGGDIPKQYIKINDKAILRRSIDIFKNIEGLQDICVVINKEHEGLFQDIMIDITHEPEAFNHLPNTSPNTSLDTSLDTSLEGSGYVKYCHGCNTRKDSVYNGIKHLSNLKDKDIILVHDAARPFVKQSEIYELLSVMKDHKAASLATPVVDTLRYDNSKTTISRDNLYALQTPQAFHYGILKRAHEEYNDKEYTDDTSIISEMGIDVKFVKSSKDNFKITMAEDLILAKKLFQKETRTGQGFDVHGFSDGNAENIRLCGVDIPHNKSLKGHSDADVALHALTDAILGAIGEGDIGTHFPPSNQDFKNMDSAVFVRHAMKLLRDKGGELINTDITIICETPKIGAYRAEMVDRLSDIMGVSKERINIKATTTEKLGFTGRGEGIAAQAIVNISLPSQENN